MSTKKILLSCKLCFALTHWLNQESRLCLNLIFLKWKATKRFFFISTAVWIQYLYCLLHVFDYSIFVLCDMVLKPVWFVLHLSPFALHDEFNTFIGVFKSSSLTLCTKSLFHVITAKFLCIQTYDNFFGSWF